MATAITATVRFVYNHPLAVPNIYPSIEKLFTHKPTLRITDENILVYGILEGDSVVHGDYVVYDPQSPNNPLPFNHNGSTAKHLALILNSWEGRQLTKLQHVDDIGEYLLAHGVEVVVIKQGSAGATVFTASGRTHVPAYQTSSVWPIGSGDIFSAVFAHYWIERKSSPAEAANNASLATAFYCQTQALPIPKNAGDIQALGLNPLPTTGHIRKNIYLAGPFFTMAERWLINESRQALRQTGNDVFSPLHDVGHGMADEVVPLDLKALDDCDVVFAIVDGLDSGTLFEVGYARAKGKPVVAFVQNEVPENLKMLAGSDCIIRDDFSTAVYTINWLP
ncbi:PfkB family carbohydrate kinase [Hymenobacter sp. PAMC 26628]|uniref:PfkB family carbohydrate kinase n=1 Tax=Hymenobacter sp. PAMC 26628 TaxID=1484118 RepID=UPI0007705614|nr:PfkB family carbohydrate kinase [Hymenobacter sp. PAMC 26628]AMJ65930.1 hypothetical protein AXW84_11185 [Hymenobacter sp. PAMC 26628]